MCRIPCLISRRPHLALCKVLRNYLETASVFISERGAPMTAATTTAQNQIGIIKVIRGAGFTNPVGVQPLGGYYFFNLPIVISALGTTGLFVTPHI
jgi:hypothetical protein